jgi:hypothetical protein
MQQTNLQLNIYNQKDCLRCKTGITAAYFAALCNYTKDKNGQT